MIYADMYGFMVTDGNLAELHQFAREIKLSRDKDFFPARCPHYRLTNIIGGKRVPSIKKIELAFNHGATIISSEKMKEINDKAREARRISAKWSKENPDLKGKF